MSENREETTGQADDYAILKSILEGTAAHTGENFFRELVKKLAETLHTKGAWVTEYIEGERRLKSIAFWVQDHFVEEYNYDISGTPCEKVIDSRDLFHVPENVIELFPLDSDLEPFEAVSYLGAPMLDLDGRLLGHLAVQDIQPMPKDPRNVAIFKIFADRAASELSRLRAEKQLREREEQLARLLDSVMDAIIEIDADLTITQYNTAAVKLFENNVNGNIHTQSFERYLHPNSAVKLINLLQGLQKRPHNERFLWVPGGFKAVNKDGQEFQCEATLSCYEHNKKTYYNLVLRNVSDRIEAEKRIDTLHAEAQFLREEIRKFQKFDEIIGSSMAIQKMREDIGQVAGTDATVLITGETGTGKELVARAIHLQSGRKDQPLIKVNCAAIPEALIESEFFGHEKGAFTGATDKRKGRFALADGGTIFLDEIGELPLDLQPKLLRVLQEGEFEPVGGALTVKVNVRVVAATNRDLHKMVKGGAFREDLYYRLHVFPISVPPLRDRNDDVILLAETFIEKFVQSTGRKINPLSKADIHSLKVYDWPGNVRELQNTIERAVITSQDGNLNMVQCVPVLSANLVLSKGEPVGGKVYTAEEMKQLERTNLICALELTGWKVAGKNGAANLIGIPSTTFSSRMKALGIQKQDMK
jgi:PAS domain S-box-containing protein